MKQNTTDIMNSIAGFIERHRGFFIKKETRWISVMAGASIYLYWICFFVLSTKAPN